MSTETEKNKKRIKCNATIHWCYNHKKASMSDKYEVTLGNLSEGAIAALTDMGLKVSSREDKPELGNYIVARSQYPIKTYYQNEEMDEKTFVGNGSKGIAAITAYEWNKRGKSGHSASIQFLEITDLVEFVSSKEPEEVY